MSTGIECTIIEKAEGWYYKLGDEKQVGPFTWYADAVEHLQLYNANPGGWSIVRTTKSCKHEATTKFFRPKDGFSGECKICGRWVK